MEVLGAMFILDEESSLCVREAVSATMKILV
jgi:hypothetical protein